MLCFANGFFDSLNIATIRSPQ